MGCNPEGQEAEEGVSIADMNRKDGVVGALIVLLILASGYSAVITIQPEKTATVTSTVTMTEKVAATNSTITNTITKIITSTTSDISTVDGTCPTRYLNGICQSATNRNLTYIYTAASGYLVFSNESLGSIQFAIDSANGVHSIFFDCGSRRTTVSISFPPFYRNWVFYNNGEVVNPVHFQNNTWSYEYSASFERGSGELVLYLKD